VVPGPDLVAAMAEQFAESAVRNFPRALLFFDALFQARSFVCNLDVGQRDV
jgi:hypothetical protein